MMNGAGAVLSDKELAELRWAYQHLEHPSLAARLTSRLASPIEDGLALLPKSWRRRLDKTAELSIGQSLRLATASLGNAAAATILCGDADLVGLGRGAFAYPDFARDLVHGVLDPKKCCITCSRCTQIMRAGGCSGCAVFDREVYVPILKAGRQAAQKH